MGVLLKRGTCCLGSWNESYRDFRPELIWPRPYAHIGRAFFADQSSAVAHNPPLAITSMSGAAVLAAEGRNTFDFGRR